VRKKGHFNDLKGDRHKNQHLQNAYNLDGKYFIMIEIERVSDTSNLREREQYWMDLFQCYNNKIGYNISNKAESIKGYKHTDETKEKLRFAHLGRKLPKSQRENISKAGFGRKHSDETKKKLSEINKRIKLSDDYKKSHELKATEVVQMDLDGNVIKVWKRIKEASTHLNIPSSNIVHCCKGNRKTSGGFKWAYHK